MSLRHLLPLLLVLGALMTACAQDEVLTPTASPTPKPTPTASGLSGGIGL